MASMVSVRHRGPCTLSSHGDDDHRSVLAILGIIIALAIGAIVAIWVVVGLARANNAIPSWVPDWIARRSRPSLLSSYLRLSSFEADADAARSAEFGGDDIELDLTNLEDVDLVDGDELELELELGDGDDDESRLRLP